MTNYIETILLKYFTTGNLLIDTLLMYFFVEYLSNYRIRHIFNHVKSINANYIVNYVKKYKYKTITLTKRRIRVSNKYNIHNKYETTKEIDAVIHYVSNNTQVSHYNYMKETFNSEEDNIKSPTEGYLEPSHSFYNITMKPFNDDKEIYLDIIIDNYYDGHDGQHHIFEQKYKLYSKELSVLTDFINLCIKEYEQHLEQQTSITKYYGIYQGLMPSRYSDRNEYSYLTFPLITSKTFNNIFLPEKNKLLNDLNFFINNKNWYKSKGIQYSFGILLKGEPGTGKTSVIKAIAQHTNRHVIDVPLNKVKTVKELLNIFKENSNGMIYSGNENDYKKIPRSNCVIVLEDIDCVCDLVLSREFKNDKNDYYERNRNDEIKDLDIKDSIIRKGYIKVDTDEEDFSTVKKLSSDITLSSLLNVLDGILESNGIIYIITTNYPDKIDKALLRPGRINFTIDFRKSDYTTMKEMLEYFYDIKMPETNEYKLKVNTHTTSYISGLCISYKEDFSKCIELLK